MSTRKTQLLKRIAGKKGRSTALTEEEKALRAIGDAIENGEIGGSAQPDMIIMCDGGNNSLSNITTADISIAHGAASDLLAKIASQEPVSVYFAGKIGYGSGYVCQVVSQAVGVSDANSMMNAVFMVYDPNGTYRTTVQVTRDGTISSFVTARVPTN